MRSGRMPISMAAARSSATARSRDPISVRKQNMQRKGEDNGQHAAGELRHRQINAAEIDGAGEPGPRQRDEIGGENIESGVAKKQSQTKGRENLRQHRAADHMAD